MEDRTLPGWGRTLGSGAAGRGGTAACRQPAQKRGWLEQEIIFFPPIKGPRTHFVEDTGETEDDEGQGQQATVQPVEEDEG